MHATRIILAGAVFLHSFLLSWIVRAWPAVPEISGHHYASFGFECSFYLSKGVI